MGASEEFVTEGSPTYRAASVSPYLEEALNVLSRITAYVSERDVRDMRLDLERRIREHPGASIAIGFGVGVILGKLIKR